MVKNLTVQDLRNIVFNEIKNSNQLHRDSRSSFDDNYIAPNGLPTEEEIDDFIFSNVLLDEELIEQLIDPGLLGFSGKRAKASTGWIKEFMQNVHDWSINNSWLGADDWPFVRVFIEPENTQIWTPEKEIRPVWVNKSPSYIILATELLNKGKLLDEMHWRDFENLIGEYLERQGYRVTVTQGTRDGGIDIVTTKSDDILGEIRTLWQAKNYSLANKVKLSEVRELSAIREDEKATNAFIVTTSHLTRDAIGWIKRDMYRLGYKEKEDLEKWIIGIELS